MRENNRNSIEKCRKKLPQFTTMNVIDGQAGLIIYTSLIFYSLTIDNILNIIVLLILAGVTIALLTGENGILTKANNSKNETAKATAKEKVQTEVMASYGTDGKIDLDQLNKNLQNISGIKYNGSAITDSNKIESLPATVTVDGYNVKIEENGTTTVAGESTPITPPTGGTITITDAKKDEMKNKTENSDLTVTDGTVTIPAGFKVAEDSGTTIDEGIVIEDSKQNQFVWVPVKTYSEFIRREGYYAGSLDSELPNCGEADATGTNAKVTETATTKQEAKDMYASVKKNGGFYIGRYEAGKDTNGKVVVQKNANVYDYVYWSSTEARQESETETTGGAVELSRNFAKENNYKTVQSTLIYGVQWDAVMNWMKDIENSSATSTDKKYIIDSTGMGWYSGVSGNSEHKTGIDLNGGKNQVKKIYDLAGNVMEWTMESSNTNRRVVRGGVYAYSTGSYYPASSRYGTDYPSSSDVSLGFRPTLFLKS